MSSYAAPGDLLKRYDWRTVGDYVSDSPEQISPNDQLTNPNLLQCLEDASGDIEAALLRAGMYQVSDLAGLTGNPQALLQRITCEIAIAYVLERRPLFNVDLLEHYQKQKEGHLKRLASGENIFNLASVLSASTPVAEGLTTVGYQQLNLVRDRARQYYPMRVLPNNR
jgi:phage gp36-like protein